MKILVTGAGGFIGSHLVERLLEKNYKVRALIRYSSRQDYGWLKKLKKENKRNIEYIFGDIRDQDSVDEAVKGCNAILNLASMISVPYSFNNPQSFFEINTLGLVNIIRCYMKNKNSIKKIVHISSSEVYGNLIKNKNNILLDENAVLNAESPYAASKIAADNFAISMFKSHNVPIAIARPFNTFGPRQSLRAVLPTIITQFIKGGKNPKIKIGNINTSRDFVYVNDNINGIIEIMNSKKTIGRVINIATQKCFSIKECIKIISNYSKKKPKLTIDKKRLRRAEVFKLRGSNNSIKRLTNWSPKYSTKDGFQKALIETYEWFSKRENLKNYSNFDKYNI